MAWGYAYWLRIIAGHPLVIAGISRLCTACFANYLLRLLSIESLSLSLLQSPVPTPYGPIPLPGGCRTGGC